MKHAPIIGLELHIELKTESKMFCGCPADHFGKPPNSQCCPVCLGLPGALPVPNKKAVEWVVLVGLALGCQIPKESEFDRKNYFYPDLPKGYQISQYDKPLAVNGKVKNVRIRRVHLEEDTGKLIHEQGATLIDFNRSGVPLMEIVTEPDINSSDEAKDFLEKLQQIIRYLGVSEADMEKGQMRCEPNVNIRILDKNRWVETPIVEIKNINSFRFVQKAIDYEIQRQVEEYQRTGVTKNIGNKTTRGFNEVKKETYPQRQKEEASDYRYFPEPDIPPIRWTDKQISNFKFQISNIELPGSKIQRFIKEYDLPEYDAKILTDTREVADYFEKSIKFTKDTSGVTRPASPQGGRGSPDGGGIGITPKTIANWLINKKVDINKTSPSLLTQMIFRKTVSEEIGGQKLKGIIEKVLLDNQKAISDYKKGKEGAIMFLVGKVMQESGGKANPQEAKKVIELLIDEVGSEK